MIELLQDLHFALIDVLLFTDWVQKERVQWSCLTKYVQPQIMGDLRSLATLFCKFVFSVSTDKHLIKQSLKMP